MSLDVYLEVEREPTEAERAYNLLKSNGFGLYAEELGAKHGDDIGPEQIYWANITHNLNKMADAAGIYKHLWHPEELGIIKAKELIEPLMNGLMMLRGDPEKYKQYNAANGWGKYENLVPFVSEYLEACKANPEANVRVSR